jgi:hypothetical protein
MLKYFVLVAVIVGVAACSPKREFTVDTGDGDKAKVSIDGDGESGTIVADDAMLQFGDAVTDAVFPKGAEQYPGSKVITFMRMQGAADDGGDLAVINLETNASSADLITFYKEKVKAAGLTIRSESLAPDASVLQASGENDKDQVTIVISRESGKSIAMISGSLPPQ